MDMDMFLFNTQQFVPAMPCDLTDQSSILTHPSPTSTSPDKDDSNHPSGRRPTALIMASEEDERARAWAKFVKYPSHLLESLRFPSKFTVRRFVRIFFKHISPHIPIIHEPTFSIATAPCEY